MFLRNTVIAASLCLKQALATTLTASSPYWPLPSGQLTQGTEQVLLDIDFQFSLVEGSA